MISAEDWNFFPGYLRNADYCPLAGFVTVTEKSSILLTDTVLQTLFSDPFFIPTISYSPPPSLPLPLPLPLPKPSPSSSTASSPTPWSVFAAFAFAPKLIGRSSRH